MRRCIIGITVLALVFVTAAYAINWSGTSGADTKIGTSGADTLDGRGGNDQIDGRGGGDTIYGGSGSDDLWGDIGSDRIYTGSGTGDFISGEDGGDTVGADNGYFSVVLGGPGQDTAYVDAADDWAGFEKVIRDGNCITGC